MMKRYKKVLLFIIPLLLAFMPIHAEAYDFLDEAIDSYGWYMSYGPPPNTLNYMDQGGSVWGVGGELNVVSGGEIDIESGGAFKLAGTDMTTQLGYLSGVTAGTAAASKAVVLGAAKEIATITTATITTANTTNTNIGLTGGGGGVLSLYPTGPTLGKLTIGASDSAGDTTTAITNASQAGARTYTIPDAGASANFMMLVAAQSVAGTLTRADLTEEALAVYGIPVYTIRAADLAGMGIAETAGDHYLDLTANVMLLFSEVANNETETSVSYMQFIIPPEYVADSDVKIRIKHWVGGAGTSNNSTVDFSVYEQDGNGAVGGDLVTTEATVTTEDSWTTTDFVVTDTNLAPGDILIIKFTSTVIESATNDIQGHYDGFAVLLDIKG
jgi:hypothetical protein